MNRRAFTLVELMVVITLLGLIAALIIVSVSRVTSSAKSAEDNARLRSLAMANVSFATQNRDRLLHPRTEPNAGDANNANDNPTTAEQESRFWVKAYDNNVATSGTSVRELPEALTEGAAWSFLGDQNLYKSPLDPTSRLRSYSLNAFVGVDRCADEFPEMPNVFVPAYNTRYRVPCPTLSYVPKPSMTLCAIGEVDIGLSSSFSEQPNFNGWLVSPNPNIPQWRDTPALWNNDGVNISSMDGSTTTIRLGQAELLRNKIISNGSSHNVLIGNTDQEKVDFQAFSNRLLPGVLEFRTSADQE